MSVPKSVRNFSTLIIGVFFLNACSHWRESIMPTSEEETYNLNLSACPADVVQDERSDDFAEAIRQSINYYQKIAPDNIFTFGDTTYSTSEMLKSHQLMLGLLNSKDWYAQRQKILAANFDCYKMASKEVDNQVLFTGYFTPVIFGATTKQSTEQVPVYGLPQDLKVLKLGLFRTSLKDRTVVYRQQGEEILPYHTRQEIREGAINNKAPILAWADDEIDLFFLQIQGSGILVDAEGVLGMLVYAGANGRDYRSIGRLLVDKGVFELEDVNLFSLEQYLRAHPQEIDSILDYNISYVFFNLKDFDGQIVGSLNVPLTYERSVALDALLFPKGAMLFISTQVQDCNSNGECASDYKPYQRFMLNQDTGGAIKGNKRADIFFGPGKRAKALAGNLKNYGDIYFIVAKKSILESF